MPVGDNAKEVQRQIDNAIDVIQAQVALIMSHVIDHETRVEVAFDSIEGMLQAARLEASKHA